MSKKTNKKETNKKKKLLRNYHNLLVSGGKGKEMDI